MKISNKTFLACKKREKLQTGDTHLSVVTRLQYLQIVTNYVQIVTKYLQIVTGKVYILGIAHLQARGHSTLNLRV